jgi:hypothetical protein
MTGIDGEALVLVELSTRTWIFWVNPSLSSSFLQQKDQAGTGFFIPTSLSPLLIKNLAFF